MAPASADESSLSSAEFAKRRIQPHDTNAHVLVRPKQKARPESLRLVPNHGKHFSTIDKCNDTHLKRMNASLLILCTMRGSYPCALSNSETGRMVSYVVDSLSQGRDIGFYRGAWVPPTLLVLVP